MKPESRKRKLPASDLSDLLKPYPSGWVALSSDERQVVAAGPTLRDAREKAVGHGVPDAVFVKVIPPDEGYLPLPGHTKRSESSLGSVLAAILFT
jgi:hypothetical protein